MSTASEARVRFAFLYGYCNDVNAMRRFYTELVGLEEKSFQDQPRFGWVGYAGAGLELMFFRWDSPLPVETAFAAQPGGGGGESPRLSWSIEIPEERFAGTVARLRAAGVASNAPRPVWLQNSYWGFVVLDPMGNTVEVYTTPRQKPASTTWPVGAAS